MMEMDYFCSEIDRDGLSIQDMIEYDVKSGFPSDIERLIHTTDGGKHFDNLLAQASQGNDLLMRGSHIDSSVPMSVDEMNDLNWLQSDLSALRNLAEDHSNDSVLMVNPQIVMPMTHNRRQPINQHLVQVKQEPGSPSRPTSVRDISSSQQQQPGFICIGSPVHNSVLNEINIQHHHNAPDSSSQPLLVDLSYGSPSHQNPVLLGQLQSPTIHSNMPNIRVINNTLQNHYQNNNNVIPNHAKMNAKLKQASQQTKHFPKPSYSYSCLIAMALKNSKNGNLPVSEIYFFMTENYPYFKTAPDGWKNSVRHNLSLNKCFQKVENPNAQGNVKKGCLWGLNPLKVEKMEEEIVKWRKKDPESVKHSMANPENLELIESGRAGSPAMSGKKSPPPLENMETIQNLPVTPKKLYVNHQMQLKVVKHEDFTTCNGGNGDSGIMDSIDPVLSEFASQNGLWDDDLARELDSMDTPVSLCGSPLTKQHSPFIGCNSADLSGLGVYSSSPMYHQVDHSPSKPMFYMQSPNRTLSART